MRILISNDDGVFAPGIQILCDELKLIADVEVIAPDRNRSGASNSLTLRDPLRIKTLDNGFHAVNGTPTDCVHLALKGYFSQPFDLVVSGLNAGSNLSDDVLYSGTVAAAMEGRYLGLPALAVSMVGSNIQHYYTGAVVARKIVQQLGQHPIPAQTILNINVPDRSLHKIAGIEVTRLGKRHASESVAITQTPHGDNLYWIGSQGPEADAGPGTDFFAVNRGAVSVTPLNLDLTHYLLFDAVSGLISDLYGAQ